MSENNKESLDVDHNKKENCSKWIALFQAVGYRVKKWWTSIIYSLLLILQFLLWINHCEVIHYQIYLLTLVCLIFRNFKIFKSIIFSNFLYFFKLYCSFLRISWDHTHNTSPFIVYITCLVKIICYLVKGISWINIEE